MKTKRVWNSLLCSVLSVCLLALCLFLPAAADEVLNPAVHEVVRVVGVQEAVSAGATATSLRFVGAVDSLNFARVGFLIAARWRDADGAIHIGSQTVDKWTTSVYTSVLANGADGCRAVTAAELGATYIFALSVLEVPIGADVQVDFTVTPYSLAADLSPVEDNYMKYTANPVAYSFVNGKFTKTADPLRATLARAAGTDLRVMHSNVLGTIDSARAAIISERGRAELLADTYRAYAPDVITFNEMNADRPDARITPHVKELLSDDYIFVNAAYLALYPDLPNQSSVDVRVVQRTYAFPIAYRRDAGLTLIDAGFSYFNGEMVSYHGCSWAVFERTDGNRFLVASAHLPKNVELNESGNEVASDKWARQVMEIVNVARARYGNLPLILNADWYFAQNAWAVAYNYMIAQGLEDASETALAKHSVGMGTFHEFGVEQTGRIEEDIVFVTSTYVKPLAHKVIVDYYTNNSSDHYPVLADLQLFRTPFEELSSGTPMQIDFTAFFG